MATEGIEGTTKRVRLPDGDHEWWVLRGGFWHVVDTANHDPGDEDRNPTPPLWR
jgi:hypothetical protein